MMNFRNFNWKCPFVVGALLLIHCATSSEKSSDSESNKKNRSKNDQMIKHHRSDLIKNESTGSESATQTASASNQLENYSQIESLIHSGPDDLVLEKIQGMLSANPKDVRALNLLGLYHIKKKQYGIANIILRRALKEDSNWGALHNNLGLIELKSGKTRIAYKEFSEALKTKKKSRSAYANLGSMQVRNRLLNEASENLRKAHDFFPEDVEIANNLAITNRLKNEHKRAGSLYEEILKKHPDHSQSMINYLILLVNYQKDLSTARSFVEKLRLSPQFDLDHPILSRLISRIENIELNEGGK